MAARPPLESFFKKPAQKNPKGISENLQELSQGFVKGRLENLQTLGNVAAKPLGKLFGIPENQIGLSENVLKRNTPMEKTGDFVGNIAEFAVPGSKITKAGKAVQTAIKGTSLVSKAAGLGARIAIEGAGGGTIAAVQEGSLKSGQDAAIISAAFPAAGAVFKKGQQLTASMRKELAPRVINSLIKPLLKDFSYGKNPGRAVAELGITASNLDDLATNIHKAAETTGEQIGKVLRSEKASKLRVTLTNALKPIDEAIEEANATPRTNSALIQRLENAKADLLRLSTNELGEQVAGRNLENITLDEAFYFKRIVAGITKFTGNASDDKTVNMALKRVYGNVKGAIGEAVPEVQPLNERYADLVSAEIATRYRDVLTERQNLISFGQTTTGLGTALVAAITSGGAAIPSILLGASAVGIHKAFASTAVKTRFAAWLAKASPEEKKRLFTAVPALKSAVIQSLVGD